MAYLRIRNLTRGTLVADRAAIADTGQARRTGLLKHAGLAPGEGLWIVPCEAIHTFGMKFPIDVAFVDRERRVRKVRIDMGRRRVAACLLAAGVLELPAGQLAATKTEAGDQLEFEKTED